MPYIKQDERDQLALTSPETPGQLNYEITDTLKQYVRMKGLSYQTINDILGALEGAKLEFYRRIAAPYEYSKIIENGDVYE